MAVGQLELVFGALTKRGDARIMHAQPLVAQDMRHIRQQAGAIRRDQVQQRAMLLA